MVAVTPNTQLKVVALFPRIGTESTSKKDADCACLIVLVLRESARLMLLLVLEHDVPTDDPAHNIDLFGGQLPEQMAPDCVRRKRRRRLLNSEQTPPVLLPTARGRGLRGMMRNILGGLSLLGIISAAGGYIYHETAHEIFGALFERLGVRDSIKKLFHQPDPSPSEKSGWVTKLE
jgi:hypothetical protein